MDSSSQSHYGPHPPGLCWASAQKVHTSCLQIVNTALDLHFSSSNLSEIGIEAKVWLLRRKWKEISL